MIFWISVGTVFLPFASSTSLTACNLFRSAFALPFAMLFSLAIDVYIPITLHDTA